MRQWVRVGAGPLVDSVRLERMCSLGLAEQVLPEALDHARSLLARLRSHAALEERASMREDLHALLGIAGEMGAKALGQQLRSVYAPSVASGLRLTWERWYRRVGARLQLDGRAFLTTTRFQVDYMPVWNSERFEASAGFSVLARFL